MKKKTNKIDIALEWGLFARCLNVWLCDWRPPTVIDFKRKRNIIIIINDVVCQMLRRPATYEHTHTQTHTPKCIGNPNGSTAPMLQNNYDFIIKPKSLFSKMANCAPPVFPFYDWIYDCWLAHQMCVISLAWIICQLQTMCQRCTCCAAAGCLGVDSLSGIKCFVCVCHFFFFFFDICDCCADRIHSSVLDIAKNDRLWRLQWTNHRRKISNRSRRRALKISFHQILVFFFNLKNLFFFFHFLFLKWISCLPVVYFLFWLLVL